MRLVFVSFPATNVPCSDKYCPTKEYGAHSHTFYNVYGLPERDYSHGMSEATAVKFATETHALQFAPASQKGSFQNV